MVTHQSFHLIFVLCSVSHVKAVQSALSAYETSCTCTFILEGNNMDHMHTEYKNTEIEMLECPYSTEKNSFKGPLKALTRC